MSKVDDMRAFREAKYAKRKPAPARTPVPARPPVTRAPAPAKNKAKVAVPASAAVTAPPVIVEPVIPSAGPSVQIAPPPLIVDYVQLMRPAPIDPLPLPVKTATVPVPKRGRVPVGARPLLPLLASGVLSAGDTLHGKYKGVEYLATVGTGGVVIVDGVEFDNPSRAGLAAMASTRASLNGWDFWRTSPAKGSRLLGYCRQKALDIYHG